MRIVCRTRQGKSPCSHPETTTFNRIIGGWCRYYQYTSQASTIFKAIDPYAFWRLAHWLGRKYQLSMPHVMKRHYENTTLSTDDVKLIRATRTIRTRQYKKRFLKPNPYTMQEAMTREELPTDTYWTGYEARPGMADLRPRVLKRDKYTCQMCHKKCSPHQLQVDHIRPVWKFKRPVDATCMDNLWALCSTCHDKKTKADLKTQFDQ